MDVVIFCGGRGTRLAEKTDVTPKPLVPIGEKPILWHIMKGYAYFGHKRFILPVGFKGEMIKNFFLKHPSHKSSFEINQPMSISSNCADDWDVVLKNTDLESTTGKRLNMVKKDIKGETFLLTYGDGVSNVDINKVIEFHEKMKNEKGTIATLTISRRRLNYGAVKEKNGIAICFVEKPLTDNWINIGFMVLEKAVFDYVEDSKMDYEAFKKIAALGKLAVFKHNGFFASMDTYKDYIDLNELWKISKPWKVW